MISEPSNDGNSTIESSQYNLPLCVSLYCTHSYYSYCMPYNYTIAMYHNNGKHTLTLPGNGNRQQSNCVICSWQKSLSIHFYFNPFFMMIVTIWKWVLFILWISNCFVAKLACMCAKQSRHINMCRHLY